MDGCDPAVIDNENSTRVSFYIGGDVVSGECPVLISFQIFHFDAHEVWFTGLNLNDHRDSNSNRWTGKSLHGIKSASIECQVKEK